MKFTTPPGVFDIYPNPSETWKASPLWQEIERKIDDLCVVYGFQEIRTPIFEHTELFIKSTGSETDIVTKEMYTLTDKGNRQLTLRPEGTPAVLRAIIEHHLTEKSSVQKLYYTGPMFRYERQQAGRYRQHHQFGVEVLGVAAPEQDAELIDMLCTLYKWIGLSDVVVQINSLGSLEARKQFRQALCDFLQPEAANLSPDSQRRLTINPLRILDSKDPKDQEIVAKAPSILDFLDQEDKDHFTAVCQRLDSLGLPYEINPRLVRGLDYYNRTVFEVVTPSVGLSLGGGGRYDGLLGSLGGPNLAGIGFATGMERILQALVAQKKDLVTSISPTVTLIALGDAAKERCLQLLQELRSNGIAAVIDYNSKKLGKAMRYAHANGCLFTIVVGDTELASETISVKQMNNGEDIPVSWSTLAFFLRKKQAVPAGLMIPCGGVDHKKQSSFTSSSEGLQKALKEVMNTFLGEDSKTTTPDLSSLLQAFLGGIKKEEAPKKNEAKNQPPSDDPSLN